MSTKTFGSAIDAAAQQGNGRGLLATLSLIFSAVRDGREAEIAYRTLTANGKSPEDAACETFRRHFVA